MQREISRSGFGSYLRASSGNIAIILSLSLPAVMAVLGVATDYATFTMKKTELQAAADAAAIAAAKELAIANSSDAAITSAAEAFVTASLTGSVLTMVDINKPLSEIRVDLEENWPPFFAHFVGLEVTPVRAHAVAVLTGSSNMCVLALNQTAPAAIQLNKAAKMTADKCAVFSNSSVPNGIELTTNAEIKAELVCSAGGVVAPSGAITPSALTDCPVVDDPLASRPAPPIGSCDFNDVSIIDSTVSLGPGRYCGGLSITGTSNVTFLPGTYVIEGGAFKVAGEAVVTGKDVGFYLRGKFATINFNGNTTVDLIGSKSGAMAGLLFFEDRTVPLGGQHRIRSANAHRLEGTIYLPRGELRIDPNNKVAQNSAYTAIIVNVLRLDFGPELILNSNYGASTVPVPAGIRASAQVVLKD